MSVLQNFNRFKELYKTSNKQYDVTNRWHKLLEQQKESRNKNFDDHRNIEHFINKIKVDENQKLPKNNQKRKQISNLKLKFQESEWLDEKPNDLENWYLVPCPNGQRRFLVATGGYTQVLNRHMEIVGKLRTPLPGDSKHKNQITILDCFFIHSIKTYFVIDVLTYGDQVFINCEAEFRLFWLKNKFEEDNLSIHNKNDSILILNRFYDLANYNEVQQCLERYPFWNNNKPELDGLLFYHKKSMYVEGKTPLVGWLYPFMLPELFGFDFIQMHPEYYKLPQDYVNFNVFIENFNKKIKNDIKMDDETNEMDSMKETLTDEALLETSANTKPMIY